MVPTKRVSSVVSEIAVGGRKSLRFLVLIAWSTLQGLIGVAVLSSNPWGISLCFLR